MTRAILIVWVAASCACAAAPDTVLLNGKIFTSDAAQPWAQALAIRGDRVIAVGDTATIGAQAGTATRRIDLGGRTVVPGFNDAHLHVGPHFPLVRLKSGDDPTTAELDAALAAVRAVAAPGQFIQGSFGEQVWLDAAVTRAWLDARLPDHPVRLSAWTGHGVVLNSAALTLAGIDESIGDPEGGRFLRDAAGRLNGRAEEYGVYLIDRRLAMHVNPAEATDAYRVFANQATALGITSVQLMGDALPEAAIMSHLVEARTPLRWHVYRFPMREAAGGPTTDSRPHLPPQPAPTLDARGMKFILDGTPIERLAFLRAPYANAPQERGRLNFTAARLKEFVGWAYGSEDPILMHAVGDGAIDAYLTALEQTGLPEVWRDKRPRLEHGDLLFPDLLARAKKLGVVVVQNPAHLTLGPALEAAFGVERARQIEPLKTLLTEGIPLALGSDGPLSPFLNIMFATTHPSRPSEALSREEAVVAYTRGSAFAEHAEKDKGHLSPGALADLAVLSADVFTVPTDALPAITSVMTMIGGRAVHDAGVLGRVTP
ncbi:MAG: amidohydrolase [Vicinamibacterales bacterium]